MIAEECLPALGRRAPPPCHILRDAGLADIDAELEKLSMDSRRAPQRRCSSGGSAGEFPTTPSPAAASRFPAPIQSETGAVPADHGLRLHNRQRIERTWHQTIQPDKNQAIHGNQGQ